MSEDSIKSAEEQLHALINESNLVLNKMKSESNMIFIKLRRIVNVLITVGAGIFITFDPNLRPVLWEDEETMCTVLNQLAATMVK